MKTKKNFLKKLAAVTLGFVMTLGVGAAGYEASKNVSEVKAAETTIEPADVTGWTGSQAAQTGTAGDFTISASSGAMYAEMRIYKNKKFTLSLANGKMTKAVFSFSQSKYNTFSGTGYSGSTWSNSSGASSFTLNVGSGDQTRITKIVITHTGGGATVSEVNVSPTTLSGTVGGTGSLTATVNGTGSPAQTVTWSTSNSSVATVSNGTVSYVGEGTATITATSTVDTSKSGTCSVSVTSSGGGGGDTGDGDFTLVTSSQQLTTGKYLITYGSTDNVYVFNSALATLDAVNNYISATVSNGSIEKTSALEAVMVDYNADNGSFMIPNGNYLDGSTAKKVNTSSSPVTHTITIDNGATTISCGSNALKFNNASDQMRFRYYASGQQPVNLFKLNSSTPPEPEKTIEVNSATISGDGTRTVSGQNILYSETLVATVTYTQGENYEDGDSAVTWSSNNSSVATVDATGKVTFIGEGNVTITATTVDKDSNGQSKTPSVSYSVGSLNGLSKTHPITASYAKEKAQALKELNKTIYISGIVSKLYNESYNSNYGNKTFWITDSGEHPTLDTDAFEIFRVLWTGGVKMSEDQFDSIIVGTSIVCSGNVDIFNGQAETAQGGSIESIIKHELTISTNPSTIYVGDIATLNAVCDHGDTGTLTFTSGSTAKATITENVLTAKASGDVTITAKSSCNGSGSKDITILNRIASIEPNVAKLDTDDNFTLSITWNNTPSATPTYKWSSSSSTVATIDQTTGEITIKGSGNTTIKCAITVNGVVINTNDCILSVASTSPYINLSQKSATKWTGQEFTLNVTYGNLVNGLFLYKTNDNISFNLTNDTEHNTATVVVSYLSIAAGASARIRFFDASSQPADITKGYLNEFTANINQSTVTITLDKESATIYSYNPDKNTVQITPTVVGTGCYEGDDATDVSWNSSDTGVATVSNTGLVTAVANGTANITCTSTSDSSVVETCVVTVATYTAPTYELYTGELKEGYYVICHESNALTNTLSTTSTKRLTSTAVEISNNKITDPDESIVWNLTKETIGDDVYWSFYNEDIEKYASFTSGGGAATLKDNIDDYCRFTFNTNRDFSNKGNTSKPYLRYNPDTGCFASYTSSTGAVLSLYKLPGPEISISSSSETNELVIGSSATLTVTKLHGATGTVNWSVTNTPTVEGDTPVVTLSSETGDSVTVTGNIHGTAVVTASLTGCESQTVSFTVGRKLSGLEIDASQVETSYKEGDYFDPTGLVVKNVFDNGDKEITSAWDYDIKRTLISSDTEIIISSTSDSSISCSLSITVAKNYDFDTNSQISLVDYKYEPSTHVDPTTISTTILETFGDNIPDNGTQVLNINLGGGIVATASEGANNGKVYADGTEWRFYQNNSGTLTLTAPEGKTIGSFTITYSVGNTGIPLYDGKSFASGEEVDVDSLNSCVISVGNSGSATNGRVDVKAIEVVLDGEDIPAEVTILNSASLRAFVTISKDTFEEVFENPSDWEFGFMIVETGDLKDGMSFVSSASELGDDSTPSEVALNAITSTKAKVNMYSEDELPIYNDSYYEFGLNLRLKPSQFNLNFTIAWFAHNTVTGEYVFATAIDSSIYKEAVLTDTSSMDEGQTAVINYIIERYSKN